MSQRIDAALVSRGLSPSREQASRLIRAGQVTINGIPVKKPSEKADKSDALAVVGSVCPFVSRGGLKLQRALEVFPVELDGKTCADIGASTGGFTDCMLQAGAKKVYAIDVGTGQLHPSLLSDPRVVNMEKTNIRFLSPDTFEPVSFVSTDVSFISLSHVLPVIAGILAPGGQAVALVKPQFEAGKENVGKKGVVRDPKIHLQVLRQVQRYASESGLTVQAADYSPVRGPEGNIEYLYFLVHADEEHSGGVSDETLRRIIQDAHEMLSK